MPDFLQFLLTVCVSIAAINGILALILRYFVKSAPPLIMSKRKEKPLEDTTFRISLAYPKLLSKRYTSSFVVHIYLPDTRQVVTERLRTEFSQQKTTEHVYKSSLIVGDVVKIMLFSPEMIFSDPVKKRLNSKTNTVSFVGKPNDNCQPGQHQATLSISDEKTGYEHHSMNFSVEITDFAFDHVSRPLLSQSVTIILSIGSFAMFTLTLLGQIDTTFGLTSGTTAGALASAIYFRFLSLYQRPNITNQP